MATQTILVRRGTKAQLTARGALLAGELGFCTDTKELYVSDGAANLFVGRVQTGDYASRPAAGVLGRLYFVTTGTQNVGAMYLDDGVAWNKVGAQSLAELSGNLDNINDGTTYQRVKATELVNGTVKQLNDGSKTVTAGTLDTHINDATKHRQINDAGTGTTDLWSAEKIKSEISNAIYGLEFQDSVKDQNLATPPGSPAVGDRYIVAATATGAWAGKEKNIAEWGGSAWTFFVPLEGWSCFVDDEDKIYTYNGSSWVKSGGANQTVTAGNGLTGGGSGDTITVSANPDGSSVVLDAANGNKLTVGTIDGGTF